MVHTVQQYRWQILSYVRYSMAWNLALNMKYKAEIKVILY